MIRGGKASRALQPQTLNMTRSPLHILLALLLSEPFGHGFSMPFQRQLNINTQVMSNTRGGEMESMEDATNDNNNNNDDDSKLVIVTGGTCGIGRATCLLLASHGYQVAVNYKSNKDAAQKVVNDITTSFGNGKAMAFQADVSEEVQVQQLFDQVIQHFGKNPSGLVTNAGVMEPMQNDITKITKETLDTDFATNTYGPFFCTREFVK